jgi:beta-glucanase (GH16 family)|tara:strand:- start:922 stop:3264 length:2343 start_codon:yes stop_codon:yes gene_type:complete
LKYNLFKTSLIVASLALAGCGGSSGTDGDGGDPNPQDPTNNAPSVTSTAIVSATTNAAYSYTLVATDADNDTLTLSATTLPAWLSFDASTGVLSGNPQAGDAGEHSVTLVASDGNDETTQNITVTVTTPTSDSDWTLVWSDEFEGTEIDSTKWSHEINCTGGGNNEKQCYTADAENSYIEDGILKIAALPETDQALPYSSARLRTLDKGDWKYGRFEIRAKSSSGQGSLPAIWMLPTDWVYGGWPNSGEIDIFEGLNVGVPLDDGFIYTDVHGTLHYGRDWPNNAFSGTHYTLPNDANPAEDFHIYAIEWEEGEIRWYVDDVLYQTQRKSDITTNGDGDPDGLTHRGWFTDSDNDGLLLNNAPYDQDFHLLINFAVGGNWPENSHAGGVDASAYHADNTFEIDYVRVYECSVSPATGQGCASDAAGYDDLIADGGTLVEGKAPTPPSDGETTPITIFADTVIEDWAAFGVDSTIEADDAEFGDVVEFSFGAAPAVAGFSTSSAAYDGTGMLATGVLAFDLKLVNEPNNASAAWYLKVEQGGTSTEATIALITPTVGEWQHYAISIEALSNAGLSLNGIEAIMVFPAWGEGEGAVYRIDNLAVVEGEEVVVGPDPDGLFPDQYVIFEDGTEGFTPTFYQEGGSATAETVVDEDAAHGTVVEFVSNTANLVAYLAADAGTVDLSAYAGGTITFDMKVVVQPTDAAAEWLMKVECSWPCQSADLTLGSQADFPIGTWQAVTINIDDLDGLNLAAVNYALDVFPTWASANGVQYRIDNVYWNKP